MNWRKSWAIIRVYWQRALTYRFTVLAYRIGEIAELLILIMMWNAIYNSSGSTTVIQGYTLNQMITYILVGNLFTSITRNFLTNIVAIDIREGRLSMFLIKPIPYFQFILFREIGRISMATGLSIFTQVIVLSFFWNVLLFNTQLVIIAILLVMLILAFFIEILIAFLVGLLAFWFDEVDGMYTTIDRLKRFFAGGYFPLSLLPPAFVTFSFFMPFAYSIFVPAQVYLGKMSIPMAIQGLGVQGIWIIVLSIVIKLVWMQGLKKYEGVGI